MTGVAKTNKNQPAERYSNEYRLHDRVVRFLDRSFGGARLFSPADSALYAVLGRPLNPFDVEAPIFHIHVAGHKLAESVEILRHTLFEEDQLIAEKLQPLVDALASIHKGGIVKNHTPAAVQISTLARYEHYFLGTDYEHLKGEIYSVYAAISEARQELDTHIKPLQSQLEKIASAQLHYIHTHHVSVKA